MNWNTIVEPLIPSLVELVKEAIESSNGDTQMAVGILMGIIGTKPENKTRVTMALARAEAMAEFGPQNT